MIASAPLKAMENKKPQARRLQASNNNELRLFSGDISTTPGRDQQEYQAMCP